VEGEIASMKTLNKANAGRGEMTPPEFCRLPRPKTRCPITGLSRTSLVELIDTGKVRAVRLRKKGAARGVTLINRKSLLDFLHGLETQGEE
jgi:hypothetical protein